MAQEPSIRKSTSICHPSHAETNSCRISVVIPSPIFPSKRFRLTIGIANLTVGAKKHHKAPLFFYIPILRDTPTPLTAHPTLEPRPSLTIRRLYSYP